jgi:hypothetical protein
MDLERSRAAVPYRTAVCQTHSRREDVKSQLQLIVLIVFKLIAASPRLAFVAAARPLLRLYRGGHSGLCCNGLGLLVSFE